ncbi:hypothetical protein ACFL6M_00920, partial [Candidatus Eisenbacteria bacterium]
DGNSWNALDTGVWGGDYRLVNALTVYDGDLIAGGFFTRAGAWTVNNIARWDGTEWHPLGSGLEGGKLHRCLCNGILRR